MKVIDTSLSGVKLLELTPHLDERGFLVETYRAEVYRDVLGLNACFVQDNHSRSASGVLRGLHAQLRHSQGKLVRAVRGKVFDVVVDINPDSEQFGKWFGTVLSEDEFRQLWVPPGYAHGFLVLSDVADLEYKCTGYYAPNDQIGILWNDPDIGIEWPCKTPRLSTRDAGFPPLRQVKL